MAIKTLSLFNKEVANVYYCFCVTKSLKIFATKQTSGSTFMGQLKDFRTFSPISRKQRLNVQLFCIAIRKTIQYFVNMFLFAVTCFLSKNDVFSLNFQNISLCPIRQRPGSLRTLRHVFLFFWEVIELVPALGLESVCFLLLIHDRWKMPKVFLTISSIFRNSFFLPS